MNKTPSLSSSVWKAINEHDLPALEEALSLGADPNRSAGGWTPLGKALRNNMPELALILIKAGADINGKEQNTPVLELAAKGHGRHEVLSTMLNKGACASSQALRAAAQARCGESVRLLLAHGANPNDPGREAHYRHAPAICAWRGGSGEPPPTELIQASLGNELSLDSARMIADHCAGTQCQELLLAMGQSDFPSLAWQNFLLKAIYSQWNDGVDYVLSKRLVPTHHPEPGSCAVLTTLGQYLRNARKKGPWMKIINKVIDYGFDPGGLGWIAKRDNSRTWVEAPVFLEMIRYSSDVGRWRLITYLINKGASTQCRYPYTGSQESYCGLAHILVHKEDWASLACLLRRFGIGQWEQGSDPGLVASALKNPINDDTIKAIGSLLEQGADPNRPDGFGRHSLHILVDWLDSGLLGSGQAKKPVVADVEAIGDLLIRHGARLSSTKDPSSCVIERLNTIGGGYYDSMVARWQASQLAFDTPAAVGKSARMRL